MEDKSIDDLFAPGTMWGDIEKFQGREALFGFLASPPVPKDDLVAYMKLKGPYDGSNPHIMLAIFDALHDKEEGLIYGLKGLEKLNRDPKALLGLKHPGKLIDYMLVASEDISELSKLLGEFRNAMYFLEYKQHNFSYYDSRYSNLQLSLEELAQHVIAVGTCVANFVGHMTLESYINSCLEGETKKEEVINKMNLLRDAYIGMARAAQILGYERIVLDCMRLHEETGGGYEIKGISHETLEKYASRKYGMDTVSTGNVPKSMKYDWLSSPLNRIDPLGFDAFFRLRHFTKVDDLDKEPGEETSVKTQPAADEDFALFRISRGTPWEEAHKEYRSLMRATYSAVFNSIAPHEQTREVQRLNDAFGRIREFYRQNALQKQQSA